MMKKIFKIVVLIFSGIFLIVSCKESPVDDKDPLDEFRNRPVVENTNNVQDSFRNVFKLYKDRVVFIYTENAVARPGNSFYEMFNSMETQTGLGSGFIVSDDGFVCTNFHVIAPAGFVVDKITVKVEGNDYNASVVGFDEINDLALLKIDAKKKILPVFFGDSSQVQVGDWAIAIGNPFGLDKSFTVGVISAVGRKTDQQSDTTYLQTDVAINPGNSGGPLINICGEVIGVNRMIFSKGGGSLGIGFAIPVNRVKEILNDIRSNKSRRKGFIGVTIADITGKVAYYYGLPSKDGAMVVRIFPGSPAEKAGLKSGDVVLSIGDENISSSDELKKVIESKEPGKDMMMKVFRGGRILEKNIRIGYKKNIVITK